MDQPNNRGWPQDFAWGVSTSAYQIEGAAREDGRGRSIWDTFCAQGRVDNRDTGDVACDHYHRYREDVALMRDLGITAYRFSIAWPRVLPNGRGTPNEPGLAFYDRLIDALLAASIEPWLCLYHWDLPQVLDDAGGWAVRDCADWFGEYATVIGRRYGDRVKRFATFNEPSVFSLFGYGFGNSAPAVTDAGVLHRVIHTVNLAHGTAVDALRVAVPNGSIGAIHNHQPCLPAAPSDAAAAERFGAYWNGAFPDPQCLGHYPDLLAGRLAPYIHPGDLARIRRPIDWIGINHYSPLYAVNVPASPLGFGFGAAPAEIPRTPIGWPIVPGAIQDSLCAVHARYRLPIYVTENGFGSHDRLNADGSVSDTDRIEFLASYIGAVREAVSAGADIRGYFVWSLLDNFEWGQGYAVRFGLAYVDYQTQRRIAKTSFRWYADFIKAARGN